MRNQISHFSLPQSITSMTFPNGATHPKEDEHLFRTLRSRTRRLDSIIDDLQAEHVRSAQMIAQLEHALVQYQGGAPGGLALFKTAVDDYATMLGEHMKKEEEVLIEATAYLKEADWRGIAAAFQANGDPLFGASPRQEFAHLYFRIVNSLPDKLRSAFRGEKRLQPQ
jgi:hemerythrin-like domain-containing protein